MWLCIVEVLDERYDILLRQSHYMPLLLLLLLLQDEAAVVHAVVLQLLGWLTRLNPAPVLPPVCQTLADLVAELQRGTDVLGAQPVYLSSLPVSSLCSSWWCLFCQILSIIYFLFLYVKFQIYRNFKNVHDAGI